MSNKSKEVLRTEKYPLPGTLEGIVSMVREILSRGRVRRLELDVDLPIKVLREVDPSECDEVDLDLESALHRVEMVECSGEPLPSLSKMTRHLYRRNLFPSCWVVGPSSILEDWASPLEPEFYSGRTYFLNVPLEVVKSLPSDTLILCGSSYKNADVEDISFSVKTSMELRRDYESESSSPSSDPVWGSPKERHSAASVLEIPPAGLRTSSWRGPDNAGK